MNFLIFKLENLLTNIYTPLGFNNTKNVISINNTNFTVTFLISALRSLKIFGDPITFNILILQGLNKIFLSYIKEDKLTHDQHVPVIHYYG